MSSYDKPIYRKIAVRMWGDGKFCRSLSPMAPSGQALWLYLLTGEHTGIIPGLFSRGKAAIAESLGWDLEDFERCFREIETAGMASADWQARLVWIPNAVKYNRPDNPNVVTAWGRAFQMLPECSLRDRAKVELRRAICKMGRSFEERFVIEFDGSETETHAKTTRYGNPSGNASENGSANGSGNRTANPPETPPKTTPETTPKMAVLEGPETPPKKTDFHGNNQGESTDYRNPSGNGMANQEQEQEQEQEEPKHPNGCLSDPAPMAQGADARPADLELDLGSETAKAAGKKSAADPSCPHQEIIAIYHRMLPTLPRVLESRWAGSQAAQNLVARWREGFDAGRRGIGVEQFGFQTRADGLRAFELFFARVAASDFLLGKTGTRRWSADMRWLVLPTNFTKVLEGRYADSANAVAPAAVQRAAARPSRLGVQPGDDFDPLAQFMGGEGVVADDDKRVIRFSDGMYLLGEDLVVLESSGIFAETIATFESYGQVVKVPDDKLPARVAAMVRMKRSGWSMDPKVPLNPAELPEFPARRASVAAAA